MQKRQHENVPMGIFRIGLIVVIIVIIVVVIVVLSQAEIPTVEAFPIYL